MLDTLEQVVPDQVAGGGLEREAGAQVRRLDVGTVPGLLHPSQRRVIRPAPAVFGVEGVTERVECLLPARRRDVEAPAGLQVASRGEDMHVNAAATLAVHHGRPGVAVGLEPRPGRLFKGIQNRADLRVGRSVVRCPGNHARRVLVLERQRVGHHGHLMGIPPEDLHARARLPGRIPRPEEVVGRRPGRARSAGYQGITGPEEHQKAYRKFSPSFFDLIVIDECHRGSAAADSAWREILEYFSSATQIGLTATPKETKYVSNIAYFGEPVFSYSLKQGIRDGFLAPYKVVRVHIDRDVEGYRPEKGQLDRDGEEVEDRVYNVKDFDRTLVIDGRTTLVARKVTAFLKESGDRFQKAIIFCVDQEHAARMRQALINENTDLVGGNSRYVMRITGGDLAGQAELGNFIDPESKYPVLVTTSRLLSTGVDVQTCRLIVLDRRVGSMTEFKQIVGRGTRVHEDTGKFYFTLIDFRGATSHFADPEFDGEPVQIYEPGEGDPIDPPDVAPTDDDGLGDDEIVIDRGDPPPPPGMGPQKKIYIDGVEVSIVAERVTYLDGHGKLVTESLRDFTRKALRRRFASLDDFLTRWNAVERKQAIIDELAAEGLPLTVIVDELGKDLDPFDLVCHIAFDAKPLTRRERAENVKKRDVFTKYGGQARAVLGALLDKYADEGILNLDDANVLRIPPLDSLGTPVELVRAFGGKPDFDRAVHDLQSALYREIA